MRITAREDSTAGRRVKGACEKFREDNQGDLTEKVTAEERPEGERRAMHICGGRVFWEAGTRSTKALG